MPENFDKIAEFEKRHQGEYYIHRHVNNFYRGGASLIDMFQESRNTFYTQMLNRYEEHFKASVGPEVWDRIALGIEGSEKEPQIIAIAENAILEKLTTSINNHTEDSRILLGALNKARKISVKDLIEKDNLKAINDLINEIYNAVKLLEEGENKIGGPKLAVILNEFLKGEPSTKGNIAKLKQRLGTKASIMAKKKKKLSVEEDAIRSITNSLRGILRNSSNKKLSQKSFNSYLSNIFSTRIGEYIVSKGVLQGAVELNKVIAQSLVGAKNVQLTTAEELKLAEQFGQQGGTKYKTDNKFDKFSVTLQDGDTFDISLGLSTKWYKGNFSKEDFKVSLGGESKFENKLEQTLHAASINKYYAYNAIALKNQNPEIYNSLLQMILARNADVFISGLGVGGDFSQFLFINGRFFSIYNILLSLFEVGRAGIGYPVEIKLKDEGKANEIAKKSDDARQYTPSWVQAFKRSREQNSMIKELGLSLHFYPNRL